MLLRQALLHPERPAIFDGDRLHATYGQWAARSSAAAQRLRTAGLQPGDRVLLFAHNHPRYLELIWAAWWAGLVVVPVNAKLHRLEVEWIIDNAQARWGFVTADVASDALAGLERQIDLDSSQAEDLLVPMGPPADIPITGRTLADTAWLFYTSGTTGRPKGVMLTGRNLMTMSLTYFSDVDTVTPQDTMLYGAPMSHGCGIYAVPHLIAGARHAVPASRGVDPAEMFALGRTIGPVTTFAAPTIVKRLVDFAEHQRLDAAQAAASFKTIVYGGAPMYLADIQRAMARMGPRFVQIYAQGEAPMTITVRAREHLLDAQHPRHVERMASVGVAQSSMQVRVTDEQGRDLPLGEIGEVVTRGDAVMAGYWRNPEATAAAIRDGWLFTGDVGAMDADGFLTLQDRSKDMIISGGSNIYPREVEEVLLTAAGVSEVSVVGEPDPEWGESVVAFVVALPGVVLEGHDLDAHCLANIARFKRPKRYVFVDSLPKNNYGKVLKTELRQRLKVGPSR